MSNHLYSFHVHNLAALPANGKRENSTRKKEKWILELQTAVKLLWHTSGLCFGPCLDATGTDTAISVRFIHECFRLPTKTRVYPRLCRPSYRSDVRRLLFRL